MIHFIISMALKMGLDLKAIVNAKDDAGENTPMHLLCLYALQ